MNNVLLLNWCNKGCDLVHVKDLLLLIRKCLNVTVVKSSSKGQVGNEFTSWYWLQPRMIF